MNSLFTRILAWLVITAVATGLGAMVVALMGGAGKSPAADPWPGLVASFFADEAQRAWRRGGAAELVEFTSRLRAQTLMEAHLVDRAGRDMATRNDYSELLERARESRLLFARDGRRIFLGRRTTDDENYLLLYPPPRAAFPLVVPHQLWVLASVLLWSYLLARHLTNPLRRIEAATVQLGHGDLTARAPVGRRDELGRLAEAFNRMAARMQGLVESQRQLLLDVSHELRSPLARLGVAVELARNSDAPARELDIIERQAEKLNALVGSLLQVSRAEADPSQLHLEPVLLSELLREVVDEGRVESDRVQLAIANDATLPVNRDLLARAVENVLRNAIRYSPADTSIEVRLDGRKITVRDYGPGVPDAALPRLFDPFYRVEGQQQAHGIGLGLSIARRAVELHRGVIRARNASPGLAVEIDLT